MHDVRGEGKKLDIGDQFNLLCPHSLVLIFLSANALSLCQVDTPRLDTALIPVHQPITLLPPTIFKAKDPISW